MTRGPLLLAFCNKLGYLDSSSINTFTLTGKLRTRILCKYGKLSITHIYIILFGLINHGDTLRATNKRMYQLLQCFAQRIWAQSCRMLSTGATQWEATTALMCTFLTLQRLKTCIHQTMLQNLVVPKSPPPDGIARYTTNFPRSTAAITAILVHSVHQFQCIDVCYATGGNIMQENRCIQYI